MAKGYPDFFGFPQFPSLGPVVSDSQIGVNCVSGVMTPVHTILGKGVIMGGIMRPFGVFLWGPNRVNLSIDGDTVMAWTVTALWEYECYTPAAGPIYLVDYKFYGQSFAFGITPGLTFSESYILSFEHAEGFNKVVPSDLYYTKIL